MARLLYILLLVCTSLLIRNGAFGQGSFELRVAGEEFPSVDEFVGNVQACVEVTSTNPLASDTTVSLETMDGSAIGPDDYTILSEQLTFISGSISGITMCRDIQIQQDNLSENLETFAVMLTVGSSSQTVTVIIFDDDGGAVIIGLEESVYSVNESIGLATVCAVLQPESVGLGREVQFSFVAQDGSASSSLPRDYTFAVSEHSFNSTVSRVCRAISIEDDTVVEDTESFTVSLQSVNGVMVTGSATVQITDDDAVTLSIQETEISITEGTSGQVCIVLENDGIELTRSISVTFSTTSGTAGASDFSPLVNEVLTIPSTAVVGNSVCLGISVTDDMIVEGSETFTITVETSNPDDVIMGPSTAMVIIIDNDGATVSIQETEISVPEDTGDQICIVLENAANGLERDISVTLTTTAGTASVNDFSSLTNQVLTIPSTTTVGNSVCRGITVTDDMIVEGSETFSITVETSNSNDIIMGTSTATVIITDNDSATVSIQEIEINITEGTDGQICIVLENAADGLERDVSVTLTTTAGTASASDFGALTNEVLTIPSTTAVGNSVCHSITVTDDMIVEESEVFSITVETFNSNDIIMGPSTATVIINDSATISIQETEISIAEGTDGQICIALENAAGGLERDVSVTLTTTAGTADASDFTPLANDVLTIPSTTAVSNSVCRNITVTDDMIVEGSETFTITVETSNPDDVIMGPSTAMVSIIDDDGATVSIQETEINITEGTGGQICIVLENAANGLERDVSVALTTTTGTASASDFSSLTNQVLTIPSTSAVSNSVCRNVTVTDDMIVEGSETFTITVVTSNPNDVINGPSTANVTIVDDDSTSVSLQDTEFTIIEGNSVEVCIILEEIAAGGLERDVSVTLFIEEEGAGDFELIEIISFPFTAVVNDTICRNITAVDDIILEGDEQLIITVVPVNPNDGVGGLSTVTFTVQDNGNEVDCGLLRNPFGGGVVQDGTTFGSQATYSCGEPLILDGNVTRMCQANGQWSGSEPTCEGPITPDPPALRPSGRTIGIAVGVAFGVALLIIIILIVLVCVYITKRRRRHQKYVLSYTVYDNPRTGVRTASSVDEIEHTDGQPVTEQPPDYNEVVGEGEAGGSESAIIEPAAADENASDAAEAIGGDADAGGDEAAADEELAPDKSDFVLEMRELS